MKAAEQEELLTDTVGELLLRRAREDGDRRAVAWEDAGELRWLSWAEVAARAAAVAHQLRDLSPGDRVAVWGRNCIEWVLAEYACALRGLVLVPLNTAWTDAEAIAAIELADPAVLFVGADSLGRPLDERAPLLAAGIPVRPLAGLFELPDAPLELVSVSADDPFLIQFTSGTTGRSKGAVLTHCSGLNAVYLRERRDAGSGGVCLNGLPYHHIGGSLYIMLGALITGGAFVVLDRFDAEQAVRLMPLVGATQVGGVPIMIERILDTPGVRTAAATVKSVGIGGADTDPRLVRRIRDELGAAAHATYGQSECPLITDTEPGDAPELIATTVGRQVEATEVRIVHPVTGQEVPVGETGEIVVRSPLAMRGYFRMPERTAEVLPGDGFLRTGDLGSRDAAGYVTIRGRIREVIIRGGENIYPAEVEAALTGHPAVAACAVVGIADPSWGELVGATVVLRGEPVDPKDLEAFLTGQVAHFKIPRVWRFADDLPLTASGKVRRTQVKEEMNAALAARPA